MKIVEKYPDKPWEWDCVSQNPGITMEIIEEFPDKPWVWSHLSYNFFTKNKEQIINEVTKNLNDGVRSIVLKKLVK